MSKPTVALVVREIGTHKEVHRIDVRGKPERMVERVLRGLLMNMDTERFCVEEATK